MWGSIFGWEIPLILFFFFFTKKNEWVNSILWFKHRKIILYYKISLEIMQRESLEERNTKVYLIAIKHFVWLWTGLTWSGSEGLFLMLLGDRQTHWRMERSAGGRHGGVQGVPDGHWGHLIHKPALTHRLDNWGALSNFLTQLCFFLWSKLVSS